MYFLAVNGISANSKFLIVRGPACRGGGPVPWSALHTGPVCVVPAASFWGRTQRPGRQTRGVVLVAGPDLPGATDEVTQLQGLHDAPTVLLPPNSTIDAVMPALATADLAHMDRAASLEN